MSSWLDPDSFSYYVIEVNPRVSRSSLGKQGNRISDRQGQCEAAVGAHLDEIINPVTGTSYACF